MLITCPECKREYSSEAKACVHCGAKPKRMTGAGKFGVFMLVLVALFVAFLVLGNLNYQSSGSSITTEQLCSQSAEAAHYIAAMSESPGDVVRVTDQIIADREYSELGDKVVASIGSVVATSMATRTPDQISAGVHSTCERNAQ